MDLSFLFCKGRIHVEIELAIPKDLPDTPVVNENLIRQLLGKNESDGRYKKRGLI